MEGKGRGVVAFVLFVYRLCMCVYVYDDLSTYLTKTPEREKRGTFSHFLSFSFPPPPPY